METCRECNSRGKERDVDYVKLDTVVPKRRMYSDVVVLQLVWTFIGFCGESNMAPISIGLARRQFHTFEAGFIAGSPCPFAAKVRPSGD
jgi:hypothetical protein